MTQAFNSANLPADLGSLAPEIAVTITGLLVLVLDFCLRDRGRNCLAGVSVLGAVIAWSLVARQAAAPGRSVVFSGLHVVDAYASFFKLVFLLSTVIVILLASWTSACVIGAGTALRA